MAPELNRSRVVYLAAIVITVIAGLASRAYRSELPGIIAAYAGDTLWALAAFLAAGFIWTRVPTWRIAAGAALFALLIELSQLFHPAWLESIRAARVGGLILGFDFVWSDLVCYATGIGAGALLEIILLRKHRTFTPGNS